MNVRDRWINGVLVDAFDWIDGKSIYLNMRSWKPGANITKKPEWEKSVLIDKADEETLRQNLHSVVTHYAWKS